MPGHPSSGGGGKQKAPSPLHKYLIFFSLPTLISLGFPFSFYFLLKDDRLMNEERKTVQTVEQTQLQSDIVTDQ